MLKYLKIKRELLWKLEKVYMLANVEFTLKHKATEAGFTVEDLQLTKTIYYEALTKQTLLDTANSVYKCLKFTRDTFGFFGQSSTNLTQ